MSLPKPQSKPPEAFDQSKLDSMIEPLTVRVERIRGSMRTPVPLPVPDNGMAPGTGYDKALVMAIETWLVTEWCGGGSLRVIVTDSDQPKSNQMAWQFFSPVPEKVPPPLAGLMPQPPAPAQPAQPQAPSQPPPPVTYMGPTNFYPNGLPAGLPNVPHATAAPQHPPQGAYYHPYPYAQPAPWQQAQAGNANRELEARLADMQAKLAASEYEAKLAAVRHADEQKYKRLEDTVAGLTTKFEQAMSAMANLATAKPSSESSELATLRTQMEAERREREQERRERETRELIAQQNAQTTKMIEMMQARFEQFAQANQGRAQDPIVTVLQEQMRLSIEAQKDIARNQTAALEKMSAFMLSPRDMMNIQRESATSGEEASRKLSSMYNEMFQLQTRLMEQTAQLTSGGGKTGLDLVDGIADRLAGLAGQWTKAKGAAERAQVESAATVEQARARAMEAQASVARAQLEAAGRVNGEGLNGAATATPPETSTPTPAAPTNVIQMPTPGMRGGRTDEQWFGPLSSEVEKLRVQVARACESVAMTPIRTLKTPQGEILDGATPEQVVMYVNQAVMLAQQAGINPPALVDLYGQQRWADFVEILLSTSAPQEYKDQVVRYLASDGNEDEDDDDDEDDDAQAS